MGPRQASWMSKIASFLDQNGSRLWEQHGAIFNIREVLGGYRPPWPSWRSADTHPPVKGISPWVSMAPQSLLCQQAPVSGQLSLNGNGPCSAPYGRLWPTIWGALTSIRLLCSETQLVQWLKKLTLPFWSPNRACTHTSVLHTIMSQSIFPPFPPWGHCQNNSHFPQQQNTCPFSWAFYSLSRYQQHYQSSESPWIKRTVCLNSSIYQSL